jgi:NADH-quinone oxidoreductase subunit G
MEVNSKSSPRTRSQKISNRVLLINHPLDCPVCDQAGECDLQNLSFEHGKETRFIEEKRTLNQKILVQIFIAHEPLYSLLPLCDGCRSLTIVHGVMDRGDHSNISTCISKAVDNEFSGNMIDVCPESFN